MLGIRNSVILALLLGFQVITIGAGADPLPLGNEFLVNTIAMGDQSVPDIATSSVGISVVVWQGNPTDVDTDIRGQRFDMSGLLGSEFPVHPAMVGEQTRPAVAMKQNGDFVVVWEGPDAGTGTTGIYARVFNSAGSALSTAFLVNSTETGVQSAPAVAFAESNKIFVVWQSDGQDGSGYGIFGRFFEPDGDPLSAEIPINAITTGAQTNPAIALIRSPEAYAVVWEGPDGPDTGIYFRHLDSAGSPLNSETLVNSSTIQDNQLKPAVAASGINPDPGNLNRVVVVWQGTGAGSSRIWYRLYNPLMMSFVGPESLIDSNSAALDQLDPDVSAPDVAPEGVMQFIATWTQDVVPLTRGIPSLIVGARRPRTSFPAQEVAKNPEFHISGRRERAEASAVALWPNGDFRVAWQQPGQGVDVYARRYSADWNPETLIFDDGFETGNTIAWSLTVPFGE